MSLVQQRAMSDIQLPLGSASRRGEQWEHETWQYHRLRR